MSYSDVDLRPAIQLDETTRGDFVVRVYPVSYTHLTLPTICSV